MAKGMTSKERITRALMLEESDRVPISFYYVNPYDEESWRMRYPTYLNYVEYAKQTDIFGYKAPKTEGIFYTKSKAVKVKKDERKEGNSIYCKTTICTPKGELSCLTRRNEGVATTWTLKYYIEEEDDLEKFMSIPYEPLDLDLTDFYKIQNGLRERGVMLISLADPICIVASIFRYEHFLRRSVMSKSTIMELLEFVHERLYDYYENLSKRVDQTVFRMCGPEYVVPPVLPPRFFDEFVVRFDKELIEVVKSHGNFACIHSHARLDAVLEKIASMKPDALEPLEPPPSGDVTLDQIKRRIGARVCLMGYIQYRDLVRGSRRDIERKCREAMEMGTEGGGYVLLPTAGPITSMSARELENHKQLVISGKKYGKYPSA